MWYDHWVSPKKSFVIYLKESCDNTVYIIQMSESEQT